MLPRTLEPEVMDAVDEAADYDAMDHSEVNRRFAEEFLQFAGERGSDAATAVKILDVGAGTALIPIEICRRSESAMIAALDLSEPMLALARRNIQQAGFAERIQPVLQDAKTLAWADGAFHAVISNSIVHHLADPRPALVEMTRVLQPGGVLFVRDLMRPETPEVVEELVALYAGGESPLQQQLFRQSLHAALTLDEIRSLADNLPLADCHVEATSDRHWTLSAVR